VGRLVIDDFSVFFVVYIFITEGTERQKGKNYVCPIRGLYNDLRINRLANGDKIS